MPQSEGRLRQYSWVVRFKKDGMVCKVNTFSCFLCYITRPSVESAPHYPLCEIGVSQGEAGIEIDSTTRKRNGSNIAGPVTELFLAKRSQQPVVGDQAFGWIATDPFNLCLGD